jgi:hypothetical protein
MVLRPRSCLRRLAAALGTAAVMVTAGVAAGGPAAAAPSSPVVIPPGGGIYDDLSVAWWKYALEQPNATNPRWTRPAPAAARASPGECSSSWGRRGPVK